MSDARAAQNYARYAQLVHGEALPCALIDLDAVDANVLSLRAALGNGAQTLRLATKSIRAPDVIRYVAKKLGQRTQGLMTYSAREAAFLAARGFDDFLVAYPSVQRVDLDALVALAKQGARAAIAIDCVAQLEAVAAAGVAADVRIPVVIDVDVSWRPLGGRLHIGVRRSPLHDVAAVVALAERVSATKGVTLHGLLAYEAHVAGLVDNSPFAPLQNAPKRLLKRLARGPLVAFRRRLAETLEKKGIAIALYNGAGTGSLHWAAREPWLTELTAGSGFLDSHLFDYYRDLHLRPAACFALQVTRQPCPGLVTVHGGGYIASGEAGRDRLPRPYLPTGLALLDLEGAGEVQTPLRLPAGLSLPIGAPVFFRHAKAGELAEHVNEYLLVRGEKVEGRAATYRGLGQAFL